MAFLVLVCGDREWTDKAAIKHVLSQLPVDTVILHGGCKGADMLAGEVAVELGYDVFMFPANWDKYGLRAGPIRNLQMLDQNPELVIAFHEDLSKSKGTAHTVREARKRGMKVYVKG